MEFNDRKHIEFEWPVTTSSPVIPVSLSCSSACNVFVWSLNDSKDEVVDLIQLKTIVAKGMDQCADLLRDYQWFSPCIAVIDAGSSAVILPQLIKLAGDQDWHRGRFVVQIATDDKYSTVESIRQRWLGPLQTASYTPQRINLDKFKTLLEEAILTAKPPASVDPMIFQRYSSQVHQAMEANKPQQAARMWEQELLADLNSLLGQNFFEGTNNDEF